MVQKYSIPSPSAYGVDHEKMREEFRRSAELNKKALVTAGLSPQPQIPTPVRHTTPDTRQLAVVSGYSKNIQSTLAKVIDKMTPAQRAEAEYKYAHYRASGVLFDVEDARKFIHELAASINYLETEDSVLDREFFSNSLETIIDTIKEAQLEILKQR